MMIDGGDPFQTTTPHMGCYGARQESHIDLKKLSFYPYQKMLMLCSCTCPEVTWEIAGVLVKDITESFSVNA